MFRSIGYLVLIAFSAIIGQVNGQADCVPLRVEGIAISGNGTLYWSISPNETCVIDHFIVSIQYTFGDIESTLITETPSVDISFLPPCENWFFSVSAVNTDHVAGRVRHLFDKVPMAPGTDLSIRYVGIRHTDNYLLLEWEVVNSANSDCADFFRLTVTDVEANVITDREVVRNFAYITDLSPCAIYRFGVRALHRALPLEEGPQAAFRYIIPSKRLDPPRLLNITHGSTYINTTWSLDDYAKNHCEVSAVYVDGSPFFNLTIPVEDSPQRGPIDINVASLQPSSLYVFQVSAENTAGRSQAVITAAQTLPRSKEEVTEDQK